MALWDLEGKLKRLSQHLTARQEGSQELEFNSPWSSEPLCHSSNHLEDWNCCLPQPESWLKIQPPLRWFPLFKCLRDSQSLAWALSEHLGERLAREPPGSWKPYGHGASLANTAPTPSPHLPFKAVHPFFCQITAPLCSSALLTSSLCPG